MKIVIFFLSVGFLSMPLSSKEEVKQKAEPRLEVPSDSSIVPFVPIFPDSLNQDSMSVLIYPELRPHFQQDMGIILVPDPHSIELNPGGMIEVDPTVDVGMIYPYRTRQRLLLEKEGTIKMLPKRYHYYLPEKHRHDMPEEKEEKKEEQ
ncbi:hypothetical protein EH223_15430 [candidate division KSB1 bacterium]|nr:hypothetical protein [candidate division KSB1 bacterium]RQW01307.1 MAG: hypothetical protein EH223_15430 [candidate division KSB1 bacterium]